MLSLCEIFQDPVMPVFVLRHILCKDNLPESIQSGALCTRMCSPEPCFISGIGSNV